MRKTFILTITSFVIVVGGLVFFIRSGGLLNIVVAYAGSSLNQPVSIGSIHLEKGNRIIIRDVTVTEKEKGDPRIFLPETEVILSLGGIKKRMIDELIITKPELLLTSWSKKKDAPALDEISLPVDFKKVSIRDGAVIIRPGNKKDITINEINLSLQRQGKEKTSKLKATALIPGFISKVDLEATVNIRKMNLSEANIAFTGTNLGALYIAAGPEKTDTSVEGIADINFRIVNGKEVSGKPRSPAFSAAAYIKGEYLKTDKMMIADFETTLPIDYQDNILTINKSSLKLMEGSFFNVRKDLLLSINGLRALIPRLEYEQGKIRSGFLQINSDNAVVYSGGREVFSESDIILKVMVDADVQKQTVMLQGLSLDAASIKGVSGAVSISQEKSPVIEASFSWKDIDIKALEQKALSSFLKEKGLSIYGIGNLNTTFRMSEGEKGNSNLSGNIHMSVTDAGFSSVDETNIGEGIQGELSGSYEMPLPVDRIDFTVQTHITGFELLSGKFYGNFKNKKLSFSGQGSYTESLREFIVSRSEAGLTNIGKIFYSGKASVKDKSPFIDGEIRITEIANFEAFNFLLRETYKERFPFLSEIEIGGETSALLYVNGSPERFTVRGNIGISDMDIISREQNHAISGIHISLPFDLSYPEAGEIATDQTYGSVRVKDVSWGGINLKDIEFFPAIRQNALVLKEDLRISLFGGDIVFREISYRDLLSPERGLRLAVNMRNISLAEASTAFKMPGFSGTLSGTIPRAVFSRGRLSTDGEIVLELFDGRMKISDLSADNLFSPVASIKSGIEIDDINLGKLTGTFDFGHISGVISGSIKDLVIVNGQAQSFTARLATVGKKGVNQKISVEALKKISILGTGTSTSLLDKGIYRFFKEYRYTKIGFSASLNNDNLRLLGIESTGNVGYLVKGGFLPPKVDVMNYTQNISFKEMVKRLKRIGQAQK